MSETEYFESLKVGDEVIISRRHDRCVAKVSRVTKTQIIIGGSRFRKKDGDLVGGGTWCFTNIIVPGNGEIEEVKMEVKKRKLVRKLRDTKWDDFGIEILEEVDRICCKENEVSDEQN